MKKILLAAFSATLLFGCTLSEKSISHAPDEKLSALFEDYYNERMQLFPLEATQNGDNRFNHLLKIDFVDSYRDTLNIFYNKYLAAITQFDKSKLDANDQLSYDIFKREMEMSLEGLTFKDNLIPINQFWGLPLTLGQLGSGDGGQPFKTIADYDNWLSRAAGFAAWSDSAIIYFRKGMAENYVLPRSLIQKMIPQMQAMVVTNDTTSLYYGPIGKMPGSFSDGDKQRLRTAFINLIHNQLVPSYKKLAVFLENEYLPKGRASSGIGSMAGGDKYYDYLMRYWTTTNKTPGEVYNTGLAEVKRIRGLMDSVKKEVKFSGDINEFFEFMKSDKQFMPYKTPEEVLNAFRSIQEKIEPNLAKMFGRTPKTPFEIRQTEEFRAASASAEYNQGTPDGSRPGIFYVPILDAKTYNTTSGMESLFLHEAIPGHHYQISLQQENTSLPKFRRFSWYGAYGEGWALYSESLGKELGLYTDPYQYMGALGDEMHRAIRLVVDVGLHAKGWTREQAIKYMMENEAISEQSATAEIERYMAIPGQALSYKIGALKIWEQRNRYSAELGSGFSLSNFHDEFLKDGCMPLEIIDRKMNAWAATKK
jgi:uncharacterized protein (DUF885 family)